MHTKRAKVGENIANCSAPHRSKMRLSSASFKRCAQLCIVQGCPHACSCIVSWMHDKICIIRKMRKKRAKIGENLSKFAYQCLNKSATPTMRIRTHAYAYTA
jgi:hypothetical protein